MATDTFTGTDGTDLPGYNAVWVTPTGGIPLEIQGNTACGTVNDGTFNANYYNTTVADAHYSIVTPHAAYAEYGGGAIRMQAGANSFFYAIKRNDGVVFCGQCISGSGSDWDAGTAGFGSSDTYGLMVDATTSTTIHLLKNGSVEKTFTGKNALTGGRYGVCAVNVQVSQVIASWEGGDVITSALSAPPRIRRYHMHFLQ